MLSNKCNYNKGNGEKASFCGLGDHATGKIKIKMPWYNMFYATETYITHLLEAARFPKAPVIAGRKVNFNLRLTV